MNLKYSKILENKDKKEATFFLFGQIGLDINGDKFANELKYIAENTQIKNINILINSVGGNVFQGYSIISAVEYLQNNGINVILKNVGIAYSIAGVLLTSGKKGNRKALNYSTLMIHDARFKGGNGKVSESEKDLLAKVGESLATLISKHSSRSVEEIKGLMAKETTFTAKEAESENLIDEIEETGKTIDQTLSNELKMVACATLLNTSINNKDENMKIVNEFLGLNEAANEQAIVNALKEMKEESTLKDTMIEDLEKKVVLNDAKMKVLTDENKKVKEASLKANAETLINEAVKVGKILKDGAKKWIENAVKDFDGTKLLLESLNGTPGNINNTLQTDDAPTLKAKAEKYEKLLTENPAELDNMDATELKDLEAAFASFEKKVDIQNIN